jgi:hypothetical protein
MISIRSFSVLVLLLGAPELAIAAPAAKPVGTVVGVALMPLETSADDVAAGRQILAAVRDALDTTAGFAEKGPVEMGLDEARMSFSCFDEKPGCMAQVGALVDARYLLWGKLTKAGSGLKLELHYVDVAKGTARTETYTESEPGAVDRLGRQAAEVVVGKRVPVTAPLTVRSLPAGAAVVIDGVPMGSTPLDLTLPPGVHTVELKLEGMQSRRRTIELVSGAPAPLVVDERLRELSAAPLAAEQEAPPPEGGGHRSTKFWLGVGSAGIAAAGVASASIFGLKALDHKDWADKHAETATDAEWAARSDDLASTRLACNVSWGIAALAAGASAYFFLTDDSGETHAGAAIVPGGGAVGVSGRF